MDTSRSDGYYRVYEDYSKTLRTWFVAYGIGAPVLLLNNELLRKVASTSQSASGVVPLFLLAVAAQVTVAALNKSAAWILYAEEDENALHKIDASVRERKWYQRAAASFSEQFWIDLSVDLATGGAFIVGTYRVFRMAAGIS